MLYTQSTNSSTKLHRLFSSLALCTVWHVMHFPLHFRKRDTGLTIQGSSRTFICWYNTNQQHTWWASLCTFWDSFSWGVRFRPTKPLRSLLRRLYQFFAKYLLVVHFSVRLLISLQRFPVIFLPSDLIQSFSNEKLLYMKACDCITLRSAKYTSLSTKSFIISG